MEPTATQPDTPAPAPKEPLPGELPPPGPASALKFGSEFEPLERGLLLGIDLGTNSVGWALLRHEDFEPVEIVDCGVRVFEEGMEQDAKSGKITSRNVERRQARLRRRQLQRRVRRRSNILAILQQAALLPDGGAPRPSFHRREGAVTVAASGIPKAGRATPLEELLRYHPTENNPYELRARALDEPLPPHLLGRALYHLAARRGFLSNRKDQPKGADAEKELAGLKANIAALASEIETSGGRTLGEFLWKQCDPHQRRHRGRHTSRDMYKAEFDAIWDAQRPHHPAILTDALRKRLHQAIFHQRPLKNQRDLVGRCELEPGSRRTPLASLLSQRVRTLQQVNHARVVEKGRSEGRELTRGENGEREKLLAFLATEPSISFPEARKLLGIGPAFRFNLEGGADDDDRKFLGDVTSHRMRWDERRVGGGKGKRARVERDEIFGAGWDRDLTPADREQAVEDVRSYRDAEKLAERGARKWLLQPDQARRFSEVRLEEGYARLSTKAMRKLLPHLESGLDYTTACRAAGYEIDSRAKEAHDRLAPVRSALREMRNPVVERSLTELRKVVNAVIEKHGKPASVRIELAREMKKTSREREEIWKKNRDNERSRQSARASIADRIGLNQPKRADIEKVLLAEECDWTCPFTGERFGMHDLLGDHPKVQVEHIVPFSRSLDDSFMNKTLCLSEENQRKGNRTPYEAYHGTDRWEGILERVKRFKNTGGRGDAAARVKLERFQMKDVPGEEQFLENFTTRQLNDTKYASRLAGRYLSMLYGDQWRRRVQMTKGGVTAYLRGVWNLNAILNDGGSTKSRDDHRHHAVDAIVVALAGPKWVHALSRAAALSERNRKPGRFARDEVKEPWVGFGAEAREKVLGIVVSHRVDRKVQGRMHKETFYGIARKRLPDGRFEEFAVARTKLEQLSAPDMLDALIVDDRVREAVENRLADLAGATDFAQLKGWGKRAIEEAIKKFKDPANHPTLRKRAGDASSPETPIRRVRVRQFVNAIELREGEAERRVLGGSNHHLAIYAAKDRRTGAVLWKDEVVSMLEAMRRRRMKQPVVRKEDADGNPLLFTLVIGEAVLLDWKDKKGKNEGKEEGILCIVQQISDGDYVFKRLSDARKASEMKAERIRVTSMKAMMGTNLRKVRIDVLGRVIE